jgi:hypothetical protein
LRIKGFRLEVAGGELPAMVKFSYFYILNLIV